MEDKKVLGILGGMGPMATAYFYELVVAHTKARKDQDHIDVVVSGRGSIPDRTAYILDAACENPLPAMEAEAQKLVNCGAEVIVIPCNTAHYFREQLQEKVAVPVLDMVALSVEKAAKAGCGMLGLLTTDGTLEARIYQQACAHRGLGCQQPGKENQKALMRMIYEDIKAGKEPDRKCFANIAQELFLAGCQRVVLGCTELSLLKRDGRLGERYLDSMDVLAEAAIVACGGVPIGFS